MNTNIKNVNELLEELDIKNKAIYFPRKMADGHRQALIPLTTGQDIKKLSEYSFWRATSKCEPQVENAAVAVTTQGNASLDMLPGEPEPTAFGIETAIAYVLKGNLDMADKVKVDMVDSRIDVKVTGTDLSYEDTLYYRCLGSPIASIAAAISSEALDKPVRILEESHQKRTSKITLEVLS
jgi:hypothetical protein